MYVKPHVRPPPSCVRTHVSVIGSHRTHFVRHQHRFSFEALADIQSTQGFSLRNPGSWVSFTCRDGVRPSLREARGPRGPCSLALAGWGRAGLWTTARLEELLERHGFRIPRKGPFDLLKEEQRRKQQGVWHRSRFSERKPQVGWLSLGSAHLLRTSKIRGKLGAKGVAKVHA